MLDEVADLLRGGEEHRGAVALHSGWHQSRLAGKRPGLTGIRFEAEVHLPEIGGFPICRCHVVSIVAIADRLDLAIGPELLEILKSRRHRGLGSMAGARSL